MGKIMEAVFCCLYLIVTTTLGCVIIAKSKKNINFILFGITTLTLVFGDAFHLIPRIFAAIDKTGDYTASLGIGTLITSITMTMFYLMLYFFYSKRYDFKNVCLATAMTALSVIRIALCLLPQNDWTGESPIIYGIYRNIPFVIMGIITVILFAKQRVDKPFKYAWLAITLSFLFYIPVVLFADAYPIVGMMMLPKTCMYVWFVTMGYRAEKNA